MPPHHRHDVDQVNRLERRFCHHVKCGLEEERTTLPAKIPDKEVRVAKPFFTPGIDRNAAETLRCPLDELYILPGFRFVLAPGLEVF